MVVRDTLQLGEHQVKGQSVIVIDDTHTNAKENQSLHGILGLGLAESAGVGGAF